MRSRRTFLTAFVLLIACGGLGFFAFERYRTSRPDYCLNEGLASARAGDFARAEALAEQLTEAGAAEPAALLRAEVLYGRGRYVEALSALARAGAGGGAGPEALDLSARCLLALGQRRQAEGAFRALLELRPDSADGHRFLAVIYYDQGDLDRAAQEAEEVARLDPADPRPHRLLGRIRKDLGRPADAVERYREALRLAPEVSWATEARLELAECLVGLTRGAEALEALDGLDSAPAEALRAEALLQTGRAAEAVTLLDNALKGHPDDVTFRRLRAERWLADGRTEEAVRLLEPAVAADPHDHRARYQLALAYARLGRDADARREQQLVEATRARLAEMTDLSRAAMRDPWDRQVRQRLAEVCDQLGKPKLAAVWRQAADACRPGPASAH